MLVVEKSRGAPVPAAPGAAAGAANFSAELWVMSINAPPSLTKGAKYTFWFSSEAILLLLLMKSRSSWRSLKRCGALA